VILTPILIRKYRLPRLANNIEHTELKWAFKIIPLMKNIKLEYGIMHNEGNAILG